MELRKSFACAVAVFLVSGVLVAPRRCPQLCHGKHVGYARPIEIGTRKKPYHVEDQGAICRAINAREAGVGWFITADGQLFRAHKTTAGVVSVLHSRRLDDLLKDELVNPISCAIL